MRGGGGELCFAILWPSLLAKVLWKREYDLFDGSLYLGPKRLLRNDDLVPRSMSP